ncbi:MAG TPA: helical backbone metal receptor [Aquabacterium sp.]|nr:helical backbone metal receptor [Aquabacterium sp.]
MKRRDWMRLSLAALSAGGREIAVASDTAVPRLISLSGGMTETVWALNAGHLVVATDTTSTYPTAALRTPKVGYMRQLSAEGVLALRPSAVLGPHEIGPPAVLAQLRAAGIPLALVQATHGFDEVLAKVRAVAAHTGQIEAAQALSNALDRQWRHALKAIERTRPSRRATAPRVLFVMVHGGHPMSAGAGTAAHAMLSHAGAHNALATDAGYKALSAEAVALARPDIIVTTEEAIAASGGTNRFWQHPGLAYTPAARQGRLRVFDAMALLGFGPRTPQALQDLHRSLA